MITTRSARFDYAVSNPPYQMDNQSDGASRRTTSDIFPNFQETASAIAAATSMIYPATWQKNPSIKLGAFLSLNGLKRADYFDSTNLFPEVRAGYPLSVVTTRRGYGGAVRINNLQRPRHEPVWVDSPAKAILLDKTTAAESSKMFPKLSGLTHLSALSNIATSGIPFQETPDDLTTPVSVYIKRKPGVQADGGTYYAERDHVAEALYNPKTLDEYTVSIQSSPVGRMRFFNELLTTGHNLGAKVYPPNATHSQTWIQVRAFDNPTEAEHFANYVNTYFFMLLTSFDFSRATFASYVPDLMDYSDSNTDIDWSAPLEPQLYRLFGLTDTEIKIVEQSRHMT